MSRGHYKYCAHKNPKVQRLALLSIGNLAFCLENRGILVTSESLRELLHELFDCLNDERVVVFSHADRQQRSVMFGQASFSLYRLLSEAGTCQLFINWDV